MAPTRHRTAPFLGVHRLALLGALVVGAAGIGAPSVADDTPVAQSDRSTQSTIPDRTSDREWRVSRSASRAKLQSSGASLQAAKAPKVEPEDLEAMYVTTDLNVRTGPGDQQDRVTTLPSGTKVKTTGRTEGDWAEIARDGTYRWVSSDYLSESKPKPPQDDDEAGSDATDGSGGSGGATDDDSEGTGSSSADGGSSSSDEPDEGGGISAAPCPSGSSVESGLVENAIKVHRAVCAQFPSVDSYGGVRPGDGGEHGTGNALDIMVGSDSATGDAIAEWVRANASELGVSQVIWSQQIWTVQRSSEGWRSMPDRGSPTANHYDHVHVSVY